MLECQRFAKIVRGTVVPIGDAVCYVNRMRGFTQIMVLGERTDSPVFESVAFSYEMSEIHEGEALCLGKYVFYKREVEPFLNIIKGYDKIKVTSVHTPKIGDYQGLTNVYWVAIMKPLEFASISMHVIDLALGFKDPFEAPPWDDD